VTTSVEHHAELELDFGKAGRVFDFNPLLPLSIHW
jgi:hypothetical protein